MNKSESIQNLSAALVKCQAEMPAVKFNKTNPFLKNRYADLGAIIETAQPILAKHGLAVSQLCTTQGDHVGVETVLIHTSGEWIGSVMEIPAEAERGKSSAQVAGSIVTYIRRYALAAMLGMYADEDGDGNDPQPGKRSSQVSNTAKPAKMTVEQAAKVCNRDGIPYVELDEDRLVHMSRSINEAIKSNGHDKERLAQLQTKQQAIKVILSSQAG
jgi:hypothetical protein